MDVKGNKFTRSVLAIHILLLIAVVTMVYFASRSVYDQARAQAMEQARGSQELLAKQTADGIKAFYDSIRDDLDLVHHAEDEDPAFSASSDVPALSFEGPNRPPTTLPTTNPSVRPKGGGGGRIAGFNFQNPLKMLSDAGITSQTDTRGILLGQMIWRQLDSRVAMFFSVDTDKLRDKNSGVRIIGPANGRRLAVEVTDKLRDWLSTVKDSSISVFEKIGDLPEGNVIVVPAPEKPGDKGRKMLVVYVPIKKIKTKFLDKLNPGDDSTTATLADAKMITMVSSSREMVGTDASKIEDPHVLEVLQMSLKSDQCETKAIEEPYKMGKVIRQPRMMTVVPVHIMGQKWLLMVSTRLSQVDAVVNKVFDRALRWAIFVVVAMTGILVSTAISLIRNRARLDRVRHQMLQREVTQAREIQKHWLPTKPYKTAQIEISAVNRPANHISGDFFNWFELPDARIVVTIGDVTGHGMSAAFLMATTQLLVRTTMMRVGDPAVCMEEVNRQLCTQIFIGQFVTMLIIVLDLKTGTAQISTAGHYPPAIGDGRHYKQLKMEPQLVLGVDPAAEYQSQQFPLSTGCSMLLYTDGVLDVLAPSEKRFGKDGLNRALSISTATAQQLIDSLLGEVDQFRGKIAIPDDLTFVAIQLATPKLRNDESGRVKVPVQVSV